MSFIIEILVSQNIEKDAISPQGPMKGERCPFCQLSRERVHRFFCHHRSAWCPGTVVSFALCLYSCHTGMGMLPKCVLWKSASLKLKTGESEQFDQAIWRTIRLHTGGAFSQSLQLAQLCGKVRPTCCSLYSISSKTFLESSVLIAIATLRKFILLC